MQIKIVIISKVKVYCLRILTTTAATVAVMVAGVTRASASEQGITVCSKLLEAALSRPEAVAPKFRIELLNKGHVDTETEYTAGEITYDLRAVETGGGRAVVAAACTVKDDGTVAAIVFEPRALGGPRLAGKF